MGLTGVGMLSFKWHTQLTDQWNTACKLPHASASMPSWLQQTVLPQTKSQNKSSSILFSVDSPWQQGEKAAPRFCLTPTSVRGEVIPFCAPSVRETATTERCLSPVSETKEGHEVAEAGLLILSARGGI